MNEIIEFIENIDIEISYFKHNYLEPQLKFIFPEVGKNLTRFRIRDALLNYTLCGKTSNLTIEIFSLGEEYKYCIEELNKKIDEKIDRTIFEDKSLRIHEYSEMDKLELAKKIITIEEQLLDINEKLKKFY